MSETTVSQLLKAFNQKPVAYQRIYSQITGSVTAGLLLSQMVYWWYANQEREFYKTDSNFSEELGMGGSEFRSAKAVLKKLELIIIEIKQIPAKTHYRVNIDKLTELITSLPKIDKLVYRKSRN